MGNPEALARRFANANLRAEVIQEETREAPLSTPGVDAPGVFQMSILGQRREEFFRIWPGARDNRVEVEGIDRELHQVVLLVQEPARMFVERVRKRRIFVDRNRVVREDVSRTGVKVLREDGAFLWLERWTDPRKRHFLCGRDERQLFICQLPRAVSTVREAHQVLRAPAVIRAKGKVVRQGEWFFIDPSPLELEAMEIALRRLRTVVRFRARISWGGNPHVADELVVVPPTEVGGTAVERTVLVRGRVRHVDHDEVRLPSWTKVVRNAEPVNAAGMARMAGVRWID